MKRLSTKSQSIAVTISFLTALWIPLIGMFFGAGAVQPNEENRRPAARPALGRFGLGWLDSDPKFTAYFHDHFGFRAMLVTAQALLRVKVLGVSNFDVVVGKDGWLFYSGEHSMDNYRGVLPFQSDELARWIHLFEERNRFLASRGIRLLTVIVPEKQSVYPEFLPAYIHRVRDQTRLDQFMGEVRNRHDIDVLDLRPALLDAKNRQSRVFLRTDTHWNGAGVYAGYLAIMRRIAKAYPDIRPLSTTDLEYRRTEAAGDIVKMLGLGRVWREQMENTGPRNVLIGTEIAAGNLVFRNPGVPHRRLIVIGDSLSGPLVPFLAQHFEWTRASQSVPLNRSLVASENPDLVIIEMAERSLNGLLPVDASSPKE